MRYKLVLVGLLMVFTVMHGQSGGPGGDQAAAKKDNRYTLAGFRHGVSHFPKVRLPEVQYEPGDSLTFDRYHSLAVVYSWLEKWADEYPDLVTLYQVGTSYEGRPIMQMTITNRLTGKDTDKPGAFFEGGRHSGEVTGTESVLYLARYLLNSYGNDPGITHLLDNRVIYLKPVNNPDGHELYMNTAQSNRSTTRPVDNDNDGLLDEDPPEDLDGDGRILTMRWKDEKKGTFIPDTADPSGRILKRVPAGQGIYLTSGEGIDNDDDGRVNEDGIGGLDLHRNYPENWRPMTEATGRGYTQNGAGEWPLSEEETWTVVKFLLEHPNISVVNSLDTSVPMHLRPPSTSKSDERMYPEDLEWYKTFDEIGKKITGYEKAGDVYQDYGDGNPLFGHGPDFGYWYYGAIWYGDEIWNNGRFRDYNNDGRTDQLDVLRWDDEENDGAGFSEWKVSSHPVYGEVEIGGFNPKFLSQNPPPKFLESWAGKEAMFNLEMAKHLPEVIWEKTEVKKIKSYKSDSTDFQLKISVRNTGKLPTALKQAWLVKIVREDRIAVTFDTTGIAKGETAWKIITDEKPSATSGRSGMGMGPGSDADNMPRNREISSNIPFVQGGALSEAVFRVRLYKRTSLSGKAAYYSTRGGVLRDKEFVIE